MYHPSICPPDDTVSIIIILLIENFLFLMFLLCRVSSRTIHVRPTKPIPEPAPPTKRDPEPAPHPDPPVAPDVSAAPDQLDEYAASEEVAAVSLPEVQWERRYMMDPDEAVVHATALAVIGRMDPRWRLWPQVRLRDAVWTMGLTTAHSEAVRCIDSRHVTFLVADGKGLPLAVIEYEGSWRRLLRDTEPDAVKRVVLNRAGIRYVEVLTEMRSAPEHLAMHLTRELAGLGSVTPPRAEA